MQVWALQLRELFKISLKIQFVVLKEKKKAVFIFQGIYSEYPLYASKYIIFHLNTLPFLWPFYLSILLFSYEKHMQDARLSTNFHP